MLQTTLIGVGGLLMVLFGLLVFYIQGQVIGTGICKELLEARGPQIVITRALAFALAVTIFMGVIAAVISFDAGNLWHNNTLVAIVGGVLFVSAFVFSFLGARTTAGTYSADDPIYYS